MVWKGAPGLLRREESRMFHQNLPSPLGMEAESERLKQAIYYRAGGENGALDLEERRKKRRCAVSLPA